MSVFIFAHRFAEGLIDGSINAGQQYFKTGEVGVSVFLGQTVRSPIRDKIMDDAKRGLKILNQKVNKAERYARNAKKKGSKPGKINKLE